MVAQHHIFLNAVKAFLIMFETNMNIKDIYLCKIFSLLYTIDPSNKYTACNQKKSDPRSQTSSSGSTCSLRDQLGAGGRMCCSKYQGHSSWLDAICVDYFLSLFDSAQSCHAMDRRNLESW